MNHKEKGRSDKRLIEDILKLIHKKDHEIADLGCGEGNYLKILNKQGHSVTGIDIVKQFKEDFKFEKIDLNKKWKIKKQFDTILAIELIEHLENPRHLIKECKKIMKNQGSLIITSPNPSNIYSCLKLLIKGELWGFSQEEYTKNGHITPIFDQDLDRICKEVGGLKIVSRSYADKKKSRFFGKTTIFLIKKIE